MLLLYDEATKMKWILVQETKRLMGQKVHQDIVKVANSLEWRSVVTFVR